MEVEDDDDAKKDEPKPTVTAVAFHPHGDQVAIGYHEGQIVEYDILSGERNDNRLHHNTLISSFQFGGLSMAF